MNPLRATSAAGRGRSLPSPSAYDITAPCEKPPSTVRSVGTPMASGSASNQPVSFSSVGPNDEGSGKPTRRTAYQW
jgi:hypothetical protein